MAFVSQLNRSIGVGFSRLGRTAAAEAVVGARRMYNYGGCAFSVASEVNAKLAPRSPFANPMVRATGLLGVVGLGVASGLYVHQENAKEKRRLEPQGHPDPYINYPGTTRGAGGAQPDGDLVFAAHQLYGTGKRGPR